MRVDCNRYAARGGVGGEGEERRCAAGVGYGAVGGGDGDGIGPVLAEPVVVAHGADIDVVVCLACEAGEGVGMVVGVACDAVALCEAYGAELHFPLRYIRVALPVEHHAVALQVAVGEVGDFGAHGGGEGDGVAPVARMVVRGAVGSDCGVESQPCGKSAD